MCPLELLSRILELYALKGADALQFIIIENIFLRVPSGDPSFYPVIQ